MRPRLIAFLVALMIVSGGRHTFAQATEKEKSPAATFDPCRLIENKEVESVQGSPIKESKSSERSDGDFRASQCFYTAAEFSRSVTLGVYQKHPTDPTKRTPIDFWKHTFARFEKDEPGKKEKAGEKEEKAGEKETEIKPGRDEEEGAPPRKIAGLGDEAFWVPNRFGGVLYVLKGDAFMSISLGGTDSEEVKIDKAKKLAGKALRRLE